MGLEEEMMGDQRTRLIFIVLKFNGTWLGPSSVPFRQSMKIQESSNSILPLPPSSAQIETASLCSEHEVIHTRVITFYSEAPKSYLKVLSVTVWVGEFSIE